MDDRQQDAEMLDPIVRAFEYLADKFTSLEERLCSLEKIVHEEIIGGVTRLYNENLRAQTRGDLQSKYGELFDPMKDDLEALDLGDIYDKLVEVLDELRGMDGYSDEMGDAKIREIHGALKSKFDKIKGVKPEAAIEVAVETPAEEPAEEKKEETPEDDGVKKMLEKLKGSPLLKGV